MPHLNPRLFSVEFNFEDGSKIIWTKVYPKKQWRVEKHLHGIDTGHFTLTTFQPDLDNSLKFLNALI